MPEYTTQFNLPKALANENVSLSAHNSLVEAIDANIGNSLAAHKAESATDLVLGHIKKGTGVSIDVNGVLSLDSDTAKFKSGSSIFTDNNTSQTFTDVFCTANSLVVICITSATTPQGVWSVEAGDSSFTITSDTAESADITFDYFITKVV